MQLSDDKQIHCYLELKHGGAALQDCWFLRDVGIISGSTIECLIKVLELKHSRDLLGFIVKAQNDLT